MRLIRVMFVLAGLAGIAASPPPVVETRGDIEATARFDTNQIRLSGEVQLTLSVEAPGPLSVSTAKPIVEKGNWRAREVGLPVREVLANGREKWSQQFRLSPLAFGQLPVPLSPIRITAGNIPEQTIAWDEKKFVSINVLEPKVAGSVESLKPPTDLEPIPPAPTVEHSSSPWRFAIVPALLTIAIAMLIAVRRGRKPAVPHDAAWALNRLAADSLTPEQCAEILRSFLGYTFAVPTHTSTTPEVIARLRQAPSMDEQRIADWESVLDECDVARFSGFTQPSPNLIERAVRLVEESAKPMPSPEPTPQTN